MSEFEKLHPKPEHKNGKFISEKFKWKMKREGWLEALKWTMSNSKEVSSGYYGNYKDKFINCTIIQEEIKEIENEKTT